MCFYCNNTGKVESVLGIFEVCPYCRGKTENSEKYIPDNLVPVTWQKRKVGFNIDILTEALKGLDFSKYGLGGPEINSYLSFIKTLFNACKEVKGFEKIHSALLSAPLTGLQDDLIYACIKLLVVRGYETSLVPYITGYELYDLVMGRYLPYNIDTFYADVRGISNNLSIATDRAGKLKNLYDQGLLNGIKGVKESRSAIKRDVLLKDAEENPLDSEEINLILEVFKGVKGTLEKLEQYGILESKRGYSLDDYIAAPIVFINLGGSKPMFKYEIPGLSLLLDIRGRYGRPTIVTTHSPLYVFNRDPDGAGQFFKNYVNMQDKSGGKSSRKHSTLSELGMSSQGRLENVTCYRN